MTEVLTRKSGIWFNFEFVRFKQKTKPVAGRMIIFVA